MTKDHISIFWFRRDLRLYDNHALWQALQTPIPVLTIFIFDDFFFKQFPNNDKRLNLIYDQLQYINNKLKEYRSGIQILKGKSIEVFHRLIEQYEVVGVFCNEEYEPFAIKRDNEIKNILHKYHIPFYQYKDQVIFHKNDILNKNLKPYTIYTPYKNQWLTKFSLEQIKAYPSEKLLHNTYKHNNHFPTKENIGIKQTYYILKPLNIENISTYEKYRNFPSQNSTSNASVYLRYGFISIRDLLRKTINLNKYFINELIWREFFMQILYHFPYVEHSNFKPQYNNIEWKNNEYQFELWIKGQTGYPLVDAGMNELNSTGYIHNRVRMVVASFLTKQLLIDWRWGEAYFAKQLLDYELSSNNGNWQWAASTGCDAVPYFRIFNPNSQLEKFDKDLQYIKQWIPDYNHKSYIQPIVNLQEAKINAMNVFKRLRLPN